jgi:hypothetical protein
MPAMNTPQFSWSRCKMPKHPQPVPPIYQPEPFADAVLRCCERPVRELPVGWGAQKLLWGQKISPRAGDLVLLRTGWQSQHTNDEKPVNGPDNLYETLPGDPGAHGRFDDQSRRTTLWTTLRLKRGIVGVAAAGAVAGSLERLASRGRRRKVLR